MKINKIISITTGLALAATIALPAFAQTNDKPDTNGGWQGQGKSALAPGHMPVKPGMRLGTSTKEFENGRNATSTRPGMMRPAVSGTVTAISGSTITINARQGFSSTTPTTTFTINATNATVRKNNATSTVSSIVVGDRISAIGTVSGTNVTATSIIDGMMGRGNNDDQGNNGNASSTAPFLGNGEPVIAGTISSISGNSVSITTASNIAYTVDTTNAKIVKGGSASTLSAVTVGDKVLIQGTINGTTVSATTVVDQTKQASKGFIGGIGQFFMHLFGF